MTARCLSVHDVCWRLWRCDVLGDDGIAMFVKIKDRKRIRATSKIHSPAHEQCPLHIGGGSNLKHILIEITDLQGTCMMFCEFPQPQQYIDRVSLK